MSAETANVAEKTTRRSSARKRYSSTVSKKRATRTTTKKTTVRKTATKRATRRATNEATKTTTKRRSTHSRGGRVSVTTIADTDDVRTAQANSEHEPDRALNTPMRRAPSTAESVTSHVHILKRIPLSLYITGTFSLLLLAGGLYVGVSDAGVIDVRAKTDEYNRTITTQTSQNTNGERTTQEVPVQDSQTRNVPRLRPSAAAPAAAVSDTETATSSAVAGAQATSTATTSAEHIDDTDGEVEEEVSSEDEQPIEEAEESE